MASEILMPKLGFDMTEGKLLRWLIKEGQPVERGAILAEIETDKATVELEAYANGTLLATFAEEDTFLPIGALIGMIGDPGETLDFDVLRARAAREQSDGLDADDEDTPVETSAPVAAPAPAVEFNGNLPTGVRASPLARRLAEDKGINIAHVLGSGPHGRIVKQDVLDFIERGDPPAVTAPTAPSVPTTPSVPTFTPVPVAISREDTELPLTRLRQAIGRRMAQSKVTVPHFYVTSEIALDTLLALRKQLNSVLAEQDGKLSVNDFVVKAAALALRKFPNLNAALSGDKLIRKGHINIGIAVAVEGGLLTIVVRDADVKPLAQISAETKTMAARVREGKVRPGDIEGSTFTTSNMGMFDVAHFVAIINPPEVAILAIGSGKQMPVVVDGELTVGIRMQATISADHRATDGAEAAQYMQEFKRNLEEPLRLVV